MQLAELVHRLGMHKRAARYILEQGQLERWIKPAEGSGHHRDYTAGEAFVLALLLQLRNAGFQRPKAIRVVELVEQSLRGVAHQLNWDPMFFPFMGWVTTEHRWIVEVADGAYYRLRTDANPSRGGRMESFGWFALAGSRHNQKEYLPFVTVRVDLNRLAAVVDDGSGAGPWDRDGRPKPSKLKAVDLRKT